MVSGEKMKHNLTNITNLIQDGIENVTEVKKVNKFFDKLDNIERKHEKRVQHLPAPGTALKQKSKHRITELITKAPNTLSKKNREETTKFINKLDATTKHEGNIENSEEDIILSSRQQVKSLTLSLEFTKSLKTITNLFTKGVHRLSDQEYEKLDKFISKIDDIKGMKKKENRKK